MKKIALLIPYLGKLPDFFQIWLYSCGKNRNIDWIVVTDDDTSYNYPKNVKRVLTNLSELKNKFQNHFDFPISLETGYKLCDFRPAYGELFQEEVSTYDHWGYGDIDLIWGDTAQFISEYKLLNFDKASDSGHFTIYKNNPEINSTYKLGKKHGLLDYKEVFSTPKGYAFDEWGAGKGINAILIAEGKSVFYEKILFADINIFSYGLITSRTQYGDSIEHEKGKRNIIYQYKNGKILQHYLDSQSDLVHTNEELYIHLQKRKMTFEKDLDFSSFIIVPPNKIISWPENQNVEKKDLEKYGSNSKFYWSNIYKIYKSKISSLFS